MEVHHPHNHHGRKFIDYLFEFFMLFLAVSAGFFVENIRESYIEHRREKEYIESLVNDIKTDTTEIGEVRKSLTRQIKGMDSLLLAIENPNSQNLNKDIYYFSIKYLNSVTFFSHSDRTISQLKNAGGLRLIQQKGASDSIVSYYSYVNNVEYNSDFSMKEFEKILSYQKEMLDYKIFRKFITKERRLSLDKMLTSPDLELLDKDPKMITRYYNETFFYYQSLNFYITLIKDLDVQAKSLLVFLEKEYNLK